MFDIISIMAALPHRYPFLLVDKVTEYERNKSITAIKNVTMNEPFFQGHFPSNPIMPGVLIVEALAQAGGILAIKTVEERAGKLVYFTGIDKTRFRKPVVPGDQLELKIEVTKQRKTMWVFKGTAYVDGKLVVETQIMAAVVDK
jgi:3-hydroxyacyl-[acyl-carrier-protein] dehydratase